MASFRGLLDGKWVPPG